MRKYLACIATLCLLTSYRGVAQRSNVRAADRLLQSEKPNFAEINRLLKEASAHEETKNDPYTYYIMGLVEHNKYKAEYRKLITPGVAGDTASMFRSVVAEIYGWRKTDSLERTPTAALSAQHILLPLGEQNLPADSTTANLTYYALVSAYTGKLYPEVIRLSRYKDRAANRNEVYQFVARSYLAEGDTLGAMPILERGAELFPETSFFFGTMISIHQARKEYDKAVALIDRALKVAPTNPNLLVLRGNVYFLAQDWARATEIYKQVLQLSPDNYDALFNLGQVYYNNAVTLLSKPLSTKLDEHKAKEYFRQSLPHLEAAYKRSPDQVRDLLGNVYYRLGLEKRYEELYNEAKK